MGAKINKSTSVQGVVAYQDDQDLTKFHYVPTDVRCKLGETLSEFKVTYWGIGPQYIAKIGDRFYDAFGAILAGKANIDISEEQRNAITKAIQDQFGVVPKLSPLTLTDVTVKPIFAGITLGINTGDIIFPQQFQLGTAFNFLVGSPQNSLFAHMVANESGIGEVADPSFGISVQAKGEFVGDPWTVTASTDLKQVWNYVRKKFGGGGIKIGWIRLKKAEYEKVMVEMDREQVIDLRFSEGSMDLEKHGRQIFELGKDLFSSLNSEGDFFKFEPLPNPTDPEESNFGWGVSLNAGYVDIEINQSIEWKRSIEYIGRVKVDVPSSMSLAVDCNENTKLYFEDLGNSVEPCITPRKVQELMERSSIQLKKMEDLKEKLLERLIAGEIDPVRYQQIYDIITGATPQPTHEPAPAPEMATGAEPTRENHRVNLVPIDPLSYIN
ncbi:hypothetical protein [Bacillus thuringiensis]|uniref:hypothetical protein n=1 Tax=Bacillus thuringiensis TaxID=1428 RepID=UPI000BF70623|nr:hypothetical protein [Bacillus thuringiensis]PFV44114.1 hypothetical protein COL03_09195 [Bacillus thuringiensis]